MNDFQEFLMPSLRVPVLAYTQEKNHPTEKPPLQHFTFSGVFFFIRIKTSIFFLNAPKLEKATTKILNVSCPCEPDPGAVFAVGVIVPGRGEGGYI